MIEEEKPTQPEQELEPAVEVVGAPPPPIVEEEEEERKPVPYDVTAILCGMLVMLVLLLTQRTMKMQYMLLASIAVVVVGYIILEVSHPRLPYLFISFMAGLLGFFYAVPRVLFLNLHNFEMQVITLLFMALCGVLSVIIAVWINPEENPYQALIASFLASFILINIIGLSLAVASVTALN